MDKQKSQARAAGKFKMDKALDYSGAGNHFVGYEQLQASAKVLALYLDGTPVAELKAGQSGVVVLSTTPFYAESGGQVGDEGAISTGSARFAVADTQKIKADVFGHHGSVEQGTLAVGDAVTASVNLAQRAATVRNHSATHLMHKALREILGSHVQQKGSLVNAERTRFDFAHNAPVSDAQIRQIEAQVNAEILANAAAQARVMDIESAQKTGAMMLFGEKYGETVRVLDIGSSRELCGGTHVKATGDIGLFKIVAESGVAAGVRRIEAVTGENALAYLQSLEGTLAQAAGSLKAPTAELNARIAQVLEQVKALEKEVAALKGKLASSQGDELMAQATDIKGLKVLAARLEGADAKTLRETLDKLKDKLKTAVIVLATVEGDKVQIAAGVTADSTAKVKAGELVNFVASQVGGKGGGFAAGAGQCSGLGDPEALSAARCGQVPTRPAATLEKNRPTAGRLIGRPSHDLGQGRHLADVYARLQQVACLVVGIAGIDHQLPGARDGLTDLRRPFDHARREGPHSGYKRAWARVCAEHHLLRRCAADDPGAVGHGGVGIVDRTGSQTQAPCMPRQRLCTGRAARCDQDLADAQPLLKSLQMRAPLHPRTDDQKRPMGLGAQALGRQQRHGRCAPRCHRRAVECGQFAAAAPVKDHDVALYGR
jgi:Ser-tRNA(Ala) deacylase AlaX